PRIRVWPVRVPAVPTLKIDLEPWLVPMFERGVSLKHSIGMLVDRRCSNSLKTRNWTVVRDSCGRWFWKSSVQGTNVKFVTTRARKSGALQSALPRQCSPDRVQVLFGAQVFWQSAGTMQSVPVTVQVPPTQRLSTQSLSFMQATPETLQVPSGWQRLWTSGS